LAKFVQKYPELRQESGIWYIFGGYVARKRQLLPADAPFRRNWHGQSLT
jgi:hypothetical protein